MLYIFYKPSELWDYMLRPLLENPSVRIVSLDAFPRAKKLRRNLLQFGIGKKTYFPAPLREILCKIRPDDRFLMLGWPSNAEMQLFAESIPAATKKFFWIWNSLETEPHPERMRERTRVIKNAGFEISTFEDADAEKYGLVKLNQFFRFPDEIDFGDNNGFKSDFYFLGKSKGRERPLAEIAEIIGKLGLQADFHIVGKNDAEISYEENLKRVAGTRCVVEVVQEKQTGLSLRALEALFFGKKLITTNPAIVRAEFYRPENICALALENGGGYDKDEIAEKVRRLLEIPPVSIPDEIRQKYSFQAWINHFLP